MSSSQSIAEFWALARAKHPRLPANVPDSWAFGATAEHADQLLALVLAETKTGTASSLWDYEHSGDPLPVVGDLSIILDGRDLPRAVIETIEVRVVAYDEVSAEHAHSEGEGDRTLEAWRAIHEKYWREHSESPRGFAPDMPVVCERFRLVFGHTAICPVANS